MKQTNNIINTLKSKTLGLAMAAVLIPGGMAMAHDGAVVRKNISGHVEVVHQIPGGTVVVGAEWGKRREPAPVVVVHEAPRKEVIIVKEGRDHHDHGRHNGHGRHEQRQVTIIKEQPRKQVTIIKTVERPRREVVVVETPDCNRNDGVKAGNSQYYNDGKQVSIVRNNEHGSYQYYKDANQVSETRTGPSGTYKYYEDAHQVSVQDNRDGRNRNVYVRK